MSSQSGSDGAGDEPRGFACNWFAAGVGAAAVRVAGELDLVTAPRLEAAVSEALEHARLVVVDVRELSFVDSSGVHVLLDGAKHARDADSRLVVVGASAELERLFVLTGTRALIDVVPGATAAAGVREAGAAAMTPHTTAEPRPAATALTAGISGVQPGKNPVNARVVTARVMDIADRGLWAHDPDGVVRRAWAPASPGVRVPAGARVEVYLDERGAVNGWWHVDSGLAVNQRRLADADPVTAAGLACQGSCGVLWSAPAAARLLANEEHCLTCAGPLALV